MGYFSLVALPQSASFGPWQRIVVTGGTCGGGISSSCSAARLSRHWSLPKHSGQRALDF